MRRFITLSALVVAGELFLAAPVPPEPGVKSLVAGLSHPDEKVRDEVSAALKGRTDALPWLRRASRSYAPITAARAAKLLKPHEAKRQETVAKTIDAHIRDGRIDLFIECHHYWQPARKENLWPVGPRAARAGLDVYAKRLPPGTSNDLEGYIASVAASNKHRFQDSGDFDLIRAESGVWHVRADRLVADLSGITFASVNGPVWHGRMTGGQFLALGPVEAVLVGRSFVACDGDIGSGTSPLGDPFGIRMNSCVVVCRGTVRINSARDAVILVTGDIEFERSADVQDCLIRATGEVRLSERVEPKNCKIEANVKDAPAPYKFFELIDIGLLLADDEEGLVVTGVKADTPADNCGIAKGDLIRLIDDAPAGHSEEFRKMVRRALVRQGDCLLTVTRGAKILDLPIFFPQPK